MSRPEPRPPRMLRGKRKYDLRYKFQKGEKLIVRVNSIHDLSGPDFSVLKAGKRHVDVELVQNITEKTEDGFRFELTRRLRSMIENKKIVTDEQAGRFANTKVSAYTTNKGKVVAGSVAAEGTKHPEELIAQIIVPLPKKPIARKDAWEAAGFLTVGGCNALLPELLRGPAVRVSGRFVVAGLVVKRKEKCARIVGHFTIRATDQRDVGGKRVEISTKAEYEYVTHFAVFEGYMVEVEAKGYLASTVRGDAGPSSISGKLTYWAHTKRESAVPR